MTRTSAVDLELQTTSLLPESNLSFVQCLCVSMKVGTRSSLICLTSQEELMEQTTLRLWECKFTPIAGLEESTFLIDFTPKRSFLQNSSFSYLSKTKHKRGRTLNQYNLKISLNVIDNTQFQHKNRGFGIYKSELWIYFSYKCRKKVNFFGFKLYS